MLEDFHDEYNEVEHESLWEKLAEIVWLAIS